jgi:hypothetical protein
MVKESVVVVRLQEKEFQLESVYAFGAKLRELVLWY